MLPFDLGHSCWDVSHIAGVVILYSIFRNSFVERKMECIPVANLSKKAKWLLLYSCFYEQHEFVSLSYPDLIQL